MTAGPVGLYELIAAPDLEAPVLVVVLDGWIDAGFGAQTARARLLDAWDTEVVATFDTDDLLDHRSRRPVLRLVEGVVDGVEWPSIEVRAGTDGNGADVLLLVGAEPDHRWRAFASAAADLALQFGVGTAVGLGAYPAPVPHSRATRLASACSDPVAASRLAVRPTIDVPAGVQAAVEHELAGRGVTTLGLWAQVPHYASAMPSPAAALALLEGLSAFTGLHVGTEELQAEAARLRTRLDELVAANPEHQAMVHQLEVQWDAEESGTPPLAAEVGPGAADELAAEIERFLRDQGG